MKKIASLCVYCGSAAGASPAYAEAARALGRELVRRDIGLVYGGGNVGLMGAIADEVMAHGGRAIGQTVRTADSSILVVDPGRPEVAISFVTDRDRSLRRRTSPRSVGGAP